MKVQCCVCKKVRQDGEWAPPEETADEAMSHGYCPQCLEDAHREIRSLRFTIRAQTRLAANH